MRKLLFLAASLALLPSLPAGAQTQIGFQAELSNLSTVGISGTVTIIGPTTVRFDNFNYDGRGGGLTELRLLPDFDALTLGSNFGPGYRNEQLLEEGVPVAMLRGNDPGPSGDAQPFVDFTSEVNLAELAPQAFENGVALTDFAGISVFCIPFAVDFGSGIFTSPADFNNDGVVDPADYAVWRDSLGTTGLTPGQLGDANSDGAVTLEDYEVFVEQFGTVAAAADPNTSALIESLTAHEPPPGFDPTTLEGLVGEPLETAAAAQATAAAVPEPAGAALLALAALSAAGCRRSA